MKHVVGLYGVLVLMALLSLTGHSQKEDSKSITIVAFGDSITAPRKGVVTYSDVLREALGFRMGPFELLDLTGLDVSSRVMASIYEQFQQEPRFSPSSLVPPRVAAGLLGRKSGEGW